MKINFSRDYGTCLIAMDEENPDQDIEKCQKLENLLATEEWQIVLELFLAMKEKYDEAIMKVKPSEQSFRENAIYSARLNGFWEAVKAPQKAVAAYKEFRAERIEDLNHRIAEAAGQPEDLVVNE